MNLRLAASESAPSRGEFAFENREVRIHVGRVAGMCGATRMDPPRTPTKMFSCELPAVVRRHRAVGVSPIMRARVKRSHRGRVRRSRDAIGQHAQIVGDRAGAPPAAAFPARRRRWRQRGSRCARPCRSEARPAGSRRGSGARPATFSRCARARLFQLPALVPLGIHVHPTITMRGLSSHQAAPRSRNRADVDTGKRHDAHGLGAVRHQGGAHLAATPADATRSITRRSNGNARQATTAGLVDGGEQGAGPVVVARTGHRRQRLAPALGQPPPGIDVGGEICPRAPRWTVRGRPKCLLAATDISS